MQRVAHVAHEVLDELGAVGWPKTSGGSRACTSTCGSSREYGFADVRRAALAFAREVERRMPDDVTTTWWRKDRDPARCSSTTTRTRATTRSRPPTRCAATRSAPVSAPIRWDEVDDVVPDDFTIATMPARYAELGDLHAGIDDAVFAIDPLARVGRARRARRRGRAAGARHRLTLARGG